MYARFKNTLTYPFVVSDTTIRKIAGTIEGYFTTVTISATCNDGTWRSFDDVDELISYPNTKTSRIMVLSLHGYPECKLSDDLDRISVYWARDDDGAVSSVEVKIHGNNDKMISVRSNIREILEETKPWYSRISRIDDGELLVFLRYMWFIMVLILFSNWAYETMFVREEVGNKTLDSITIEDVRSAIWFLALVGFVLFVFLRLLRIAIIRPKRMLFPYGVILIGSETQEENGKRDLRLLYIGGVISAIVGLVTSLLIYL